MAKADWNLFEFGTASNFTQVTSDIDETPSQVSSGGGQKSLEINIPSGWAGAATPPVFGYMYNGPDASDFPLQNGQISFSVRTSGNTLLCAGVILRSQTLLNGTVGSANDLNYYMFGITQDNSIAGDPNVGVFRVVNGVPTLLTGVNIASIVDPVSDFIQSEIRLIDDTPSGGDVRVQWRQNQGFQLTPPGQPGWDSFSIFRDDLTPGVLLNSAGFWGFGVMSRTSMSTTLDQTVSFDRIQISQELVE